MKQIVRGRVVRKVLRKNHLPVTMYDFPSMYGTYSIPCKVVQNLGRGVCVISFVDPIVGILNERRVPRTSVYRA